MTTPDSRPVPPLEPQPEDCCGGGCANCVYIRYGIALEGYHDALRAWQMRNPDSGTPPPS